MTDSQKYMFLVSSPCKHRSGVTDEWGIKHRSHTDWQINYMWWHPPNKSTQQSVRLFKLYCSQPNGSQGTNVVQYRYWMISGLGNKSYWVVWDGINLDWPEGYKHGEEPAIWRAIHSWFLCLQEMLTNGFYHSPTNNNTEPATPSSWRWHGGF